MTLYSAKTGVDISSSNFHGFSSRHKIPSRTGTFIERLLLLGFLSQFILMIFQSSCIGFKSRESPGNSKTVILLKYQNCVLRIYDEYNEHCRA